MNIISIITAKCGSKSIAKNNMIQICGKPLIGWTIEQSLHTDLINHTFVTTDSDEIAQISETLGAKIIMRPYSIRGDVATSETVLIYALEFIKTNYNVEPDLVVLLQAASPLRKTNDINECIKKLIHSNCDSIFSGCLIEDFPIWEYSDEKWKSLHYDYLKRNVIKNRKPQYAENGSIYVFKPSILTEFNNWLGGKISFFEMDFWQSWEINNLEDIEIVEGFMTIKMKQLSKPKIYLKDIDLIVYDFDGVMTDNTASVDENGKESVRVNRGDGLAINYFRKAGIKQIILSTEKNIVVKKRAEKLQIDCYNSTENKEEFLQGFVKDHKISMKKVLYLGNDINDLEAMKIVGIPICPNDAFPEIKSISRIVLERNGGYGVIRNLYEILK